MAVVLSGMRWVRILVADVATPVVHGVLVAMTIIVYTLFALEPQGANEGRSPRSPA